MVAELKVYDSAEKFMDDMESEVAKLKSTLGEYLRKLDEIRLAAEKTKKIRETVFKLAGKRMDKDDEDEVPIGDVTIVLNVNPFNELTAMEEAVRSLQEKLLSLEKTREAVKWLDQFKDAGGIKLLVLEKDGVPRKIMIKVT
jgi:prefoldin subunit 5